MKDIRDYKFISRLAALPFVEAIWLFGSRALGHALERSDIDIAIICPNASEDEWRIVKYIIEDADTLLHIDCVRFDKLPLEEKLRYNILEQKQVLYERGK